ncbi:MAG: hypothetical protein O2930_04810 [Acidobacteria bacterium]|nr:hypothetical protein [Acidobacteriota bacterium]
MDRTIRAVMIGLAILVVAAVAFSDMVGSMMGTGPGTPGMMQAPGWTWGLSMFAFCGVLLIGLALVVRALGMNRRRRGSLLDVLERRYAAGDLTREQYEKMRREFEQQEGATSSTPD